LLDKTTQSIPKKREKKRKENNAEIGGSTK
jgi:hypothetical protein